jgi:Fe2+ or Zn2+ uptake regulation protein
VADMQRNTIQRQIILETLKKFHTHPTVEELYAEIQKSHPAISKTTIYRNLRQLVQGGQAGNVALPNDAERFDQRTDRHYHFQCKSCGALYDVDINYLEEINERVREKYDFQVDAHDIIFKGICMRCKDGTSK